MAAGSVAYRPGAQATQAADALAPTIKPYVPAAHAAHWREDDAPAATPYLPRLQATQELVAAKSLKVPARQPVQVADVADALVVEYRPGPHATHTADELANTAVGFPYFPKGHTLHVLAPTAPVNLPRTHTVHTDAEVARATLP